jgi:hypothetical protein
MRGLRRRRSQGETHYPARRALRQSSPRPANNALRPPLPPPIRPSLAPPRSTKRSSPHPISSRSDWTGARSDRVCTSRVKCGRSEGAGVVDPWEAGLGPGRAATFERQTTPCVLPCLLQSDHHLPRRGRRSGGTASDWTGARSDRVCTSRVKCGRSEGAGVVDPWELQTWSCRYFRTANNALRPPLPPPIRPSLAPPRSRVCTSRVKCGRSEGAGVVDPWEAGLGETSEMI